MSKDMITYILKEIEEYARVACDCDNCKGEKYYYDGTLMRYFLDKLCDHFDLSEKIKEAIEYDVFRGDIFVSDVVSDGIKRYRFACKGRGWFECESCLRCCSMSALHCTNLKSVPWLGVCRRCYGEHKKMNEIEEIEEIEECADNDNIMSLAWKLKELIKNYRLTYENQGWSVCQRCLRNFRFDENCVGPYCSDCDIEIEKGLIKTEVKNS